MKLTLKEILHKIDYSLTQSVNQTDMLCELNLDIFDEGIDFLEDSLFTEIYFESWMCTDTLVGKSIIFYDNEAVCLAYKPARKDPKEFCWIGEGTCERIQKIVYDLIPDKLKKIYPEIVTLEHQVYFDDKLSKLKE